MKERGKTPPVEYVSAPESVIRFHWQVVLLCETVVLFCKIVVDGRIVVGGGEESLLCQGAALC